MAIITLLPNEPGIENEAAQEVLTMEWLMPALGELEALFIALRRSLDPELGQALMHFVRHGGCIRQVWGGSAR